MLRFCNLPPDIIPPDNNALIPVAYSPKWVPAGFNIVPGVANRFINKNNKKQFSVFISNPNTQFTRWNLCKRKLHFD